MEGRDGRSSQRACRRTTHGSRSCGRGSARIRTIRWACTWAPRPVSSTTRAMTETHGVSWRITCPRSRALTLAWLAADRSVRASGPRRALNLRRLTALEGFPGVLEERVRLLLGRPLQEACA